MNEREILVKSIKELLNDCSDVELLYLIEGLLATER